MSAIAGRTMIVRRNGVQVAGIRTKSITINGSPIDVTNDDDAAVRKLLDAPGQVDVAIQVSGILLNNTLRSESLGTTDRVAAMSFESGGGSPTPGFNGDFFMESYEEAGEYNGAGTFTANFLSAGTVTYTE